MRKTYFHLSLSLVYFIDFKCLDVAFPRNSCYSLSFYFFLPRKILVSREKFAVKTMWLHLKERLARFWANLPSFAPHLEIEKTKFKWKYNLLNSSEI